MIKLKYLLIFIILFFLFDSCGVIIDYVLIKGKWKLQNVDYYYYTNPNLESYKKIGGKADISSDTTTPINGVFFGNFKYKNFIIEFIEKDKLKKIYSFNLYGYNTSSSIVKLLEDNSNDSESICIVDESDNSITIKTGNFKNSDKTKNFWLKGIEFKNNWPLTTNNITTSSGTTSNSVMELYIDVSNIDKSCLKYDKTSDFYYIDGDLSGDNELLIYSMKAIFVKTN